MEVEVDSGRIMVGGGQAIVKPAGCLFSLGTEYEVQHHAKRYKFPILYVRHAVGFFTIWT